MAGLTGLLKVRSRGCKEAARSFRRVHAHFHLFGKARNSRELIVAEVRLGNAI